MNWITQGVTNYVGGYVDSMIANAVQAGGSFAGDGVAAVGNAINGVGGNINNSIRRYGDGAKDYGNSIKDWTNASGVRQPTAFNPLGLSDTQGGGKRSLSSVPGSMTAYQPKSSGSPAFKPPASVGTKSAVKPKSTPASSVPKTLPAPAKGPSKTPSKSPAKAPANKPTTSGTAKKTDLPDSKMKYTPGVVTGMPNKPATGAAKKSVAK